MEGKERAGKEPEKWDVYKERRTGMHTGKGRKETRLLLLETELD